MSQSPEIYGFSGKLGVGKNYIAENLFYHALPQKNTLIMALADHFKVDTVSKDNVEFDKVFVKKDEQTRRLLQIRGTEEGRDKYGKDIWIRTIQTWIKLYHDRGVERFIITDIRFPNEAEWVHQMGGITFRINAPERNEQALQQESECDPKKYHAISTHASETGLDSYQNFTYMINNDYGQEDQVTIQIEEIANELSSEPSGTLEKKTKSRRLK
jgi:hypothetical protein